MDSREQLGATTTALLDERDDLALVFAEISGQFFHDAAARHPERVINVGTASSCSSAPEEGWPSVASDR
ncbi:hypothetical protein MM440_00490 [Arsenicicoccus piscis]|uniref:Uncharacterized protein n=1 Tax=Arsenicicoccus piscis TaxID=673954 RepID=A0ABQ6HR18_9MICO|nr:hypothetical protein [Arsenicicoccus piscis]MCH8626305.1 hypothetical protein [Arsenicicoccus piscis]GMA20908.1 hypothetical protein GCM10025862_29290 [Arsenicicoccus piscis]